MPYVERVAFAIAIPVVRPAEVQDEGYSDKIGELVQNASVTVRLALYRPRISCADYTTGVNRRVEEV